MALCIATYIIACVQHCYHTAGCLFTAATDSAVRAPQGQRQQAEANPEDTERREDEELRDLGKAHAGKLGSHKLLVPTKSKQNVQEVDVSELTNEQREDIIDRVLEVLMLSDIECVQ